MSGLVPSRTRPHPLPPRRLDHESQDPGPARRRIPGRDGAHRGDARRWVHRGGTPRPPQRPTTSRRTSPRTARISRPTDYRDTFEYLGSYAVATKPDKPVDEMHVVYARPEDVRAYRRDGKFPDGATLVKEVTRVGSEKLTTGQSHWATDVKLWFVMIKDAKGRFPANDLWGDGWGWALFLAKRAGPQRGDRLFDRLQDVPRPGPQGRLGVRARIPCAREVRPGQMNRESNTTRISDYSSRGVSGEDRLPYG